MKRWNNLHWFVRLLIALMLALAIIYAAAYFLGRVTVESAHGATPSRPPKAWLHKGALISVTTTSGTMAAAARNSRERCATHWSEKKGHAPIGTIFWVKLTKTWCYRKRSHRVTFAPRPKVEHAVTSAGALMQWDDKGVNDQINGFFPYNGFPRGGHQSWAQVYFKRCFPTPFGCVKVGSSNVSVEVIGHYDGTYTAD